MSADDLQVAVRALIAELKADGALREPQWIWIDQTNGVCTLERPVSQGRPLQYDVEFVFRRPEGSEEVRRRLWNRSERLKELVESMCARLLVYRAARPATRAVSQSLGAQRQAGPAA